MSLAKFRFLFLSVSPRETVKTLVTSQMYTIKVEKSKKSIL